MDERELEAFMRPLIGALSERRLDGIVAAAQPDVEFVSLLAGVEGQTYRGHDGLARWLEDVRDTWQDSTWAFRGAIPVGDERAVFAMEMASVARASGVDMTIRVWGAAEFESGRIRRMEACLGEAEAFAALGLSPREAVARRVFAAATQGRVADVADVIDPAMEFVSVVAGTAGQPYRGPEGVEAWVERVRTLYHDILWDVHDVHPAGEYEVVRFRFRGTARESGVPYDLEMSQLWSFGPDDRCTRVEVFPDPDAAERAAGGQPP